MLVIECGGKLPQCCFVVWCWLSGGMICRLSGSLGGGMICRLSGSLNDELNRLVEWLLEWLLEDF